jgi:hypothetical protein
MHKVLTGLFLLITLSAMAQEKPLPAELKPFVRSGYEVLDWATEDLNADKRKDYVLILKKQGEDTVGVESDVWTIQRPLLLLTKRADGSLQVAAENNELVYCRHCGGAMGDPFDGLTLSPGVIKLDFYGGSNWRWSQAILFRYDKVKKDWFMEEDDLSSFQAMDMDNTLSSAMIKRIESGDIRLKDYTPDYNRDTSSWKVTVAKAWFYESPELKSAHKKSYLVKGDIIKSVKSYAHFIDCFYTNKQGQTTSGYILKKDLQQLPARKAGTGQ